MSSNDKPRRKRSLDSPESMSRPGKTMRSTTSKLICLIAVVSGGVVLRAHASQPFPDWIDDASGCKVKNPQSQPAETIEWSGRCKLGYADGPGVVRWFSGGKPNGMTSGTFREGRLTGRGSVTLPHAVFSRTYIPKGDFRSPRVWPFGSRLDGVFSDNKLVGEGIVTEPNGQRTVVIQIDGRLVRK